MLTIPKNLLCFRSKLKNRLERNIYLVYVYNLFWKMQFSAPIEAIFFTTVTGDFIKAMSVYSIAQMTGAILDLPMGILSDRFGRKKISVVCAFARLVSIVIYALANSYFMLVVGALFYGLHKALSGPNCDALVYETLRDLNRSDAYHQTISKCKSFSSFGLALGAIFCSIFTLISLRVVMAMTIIPIGIAFLTTLFFTEPMSQRVKRNNPFQHLKKAFLYLLKNKRLLFFSVADSLHYGLNESSFTFNGNFFKTIIPLWSLGFLRFAGHLVNSVASYFSAQVGKLIGVEKTILIGAMVDNVLNIVSIASANLISPVLKTFASGANGIYCPASIAYLQSEVSADERVTLLSIASLMNCAVYSMGMLLVGFLADKYSPYWAMLICYSFAFVSNGMYVVAFKQAGYKAA